MRLVLTIYPRITDLVDCWPDWEMPILYADLSLAIEHSWNDLLPNIAFRYLGESPAERFSPLSFLFVIE